MSSSPFLTLPLSYPYDVSFDQELQGQGERASNTARYTASYDAQHWAASASYLAVPQQQQNFSPISPTLSIDSMPYSPSLSCYSPYTTKESEYASYGGQWQDPPFDSMSFAQWSLPEDRWNLDPFLPSYPCNSAGGMSSALSSPLAYNSTLLPPCPSPALSCSSGRLSPLISSDFSSASSSSSSPPRSLATRRSSRTTGPKICAHCSATSTPLWRRDPATHEPLCNACGLYLQQRNKMRPPALIAADRPEAPSDDDDDEGAASGGPKCAHCGTHKTSVWRRSKTGEKVCNACGVYQRLRGKDRPLALRRSKIRPRCKHAPQS